MKLNYTLIVLAFLCSFVSGISAQSPTDLIISEYVEGSSNNKAIELYNGTGSSIDLTAGNYLIQMYSNGNSTPSITITLTGVLSNNDVYILAHGSATFITANGGTVVPDFTSTTTAGWFNGDDAIVLRKGGAAGSIVDVVGQVGSDPGTEWGTGLTSTADNTLRRKATICNGDTNPSDAFDPSIQWDGFAQDVFIGIGSHTSSCTISGTSIVLNPVSLNFSTPSGTASVEQSYTVKGDGLTSDITVTIPALSNFGISLTAGGPYESTINITAAAANAAPVAVYVIFNSPSPGTQSGSITHVSGTANSNLAVQGNATVGGTTKIYDIQGSGLLSPYEGVIVTTVGLVTADFQGANQLSGFFIQDTTGDGLSATSDGIFVFNTSFSVQPGDYITLTGEVDEFFNKTELKNISALIINSSGNALPVPKTISLPSAPGSIESFEGMYVSFPQTLSVSEVFTLGRYGEVVLSVNGPLINPTSVVDPNDNPASGTTSNGNSNLAAVIAYQNMNNVSKILLDDGSSVQNPAIVPYLNPADTTLRVGSTVANVTGALDYDFDVYRIQPTVSPSFNYAARPTVPSVGAGNIKVASFNVLNYFNGDGLGGGFPTSRGANTVTEFNRQRIKILSAISAIDADIVGLIEIENDGSGAQSAIADLVNGLNAATSPANYAYITDPTLANGGTGTDEIKVAIIYKPSKVTPQGLSRSDASTIHNRPPLAQTFTVNNTSEKFSFIVNHFKSKSCSGATGLNTDQGDGQACFNENRKLQAQALLAFISSVQSASGDQDIITVGDYNAYEEEDPIDILRAGGLVNPVASGIYSYVFNGQSGSLDYAFITPSLSARITGADKWHINSAEPIIKDYNQEFNQPYVYSPDAFRSSDHDPVLVGLRLGNTPPTVTIISPTDNSVIPAGSPVNLEATAGDTDGSVSKVEFYNNGLLFMTDSIAPYTFMSSEVEPGVYRVTAKAYDNAGDSTVSDTLHVTISGCEGSGSITAEGYTGIPGSTLVSLASDPDYPNNPDIVTELTRFEYGPNFADNYGGRLRGYICAPQTGYYVFYISSDEQSELWLSTDANPANMRRIAYVQGNTGFRSWFSNAQQRSVSIRLLKGVRYYVETVHKEGTGTDHLSVGWQKPGGVFEGPIAGAYLSPLGSDTPAMAAARTTTGFEVALREAGEGLAKGLEVKATPNPSSGYFRLQIKSNKPEGVSVKLIDVQGRIVETRTGVSSNGILEIGKTITAAGVYFVEVQQGETRKQIRVVRQ